MSNVIRKMERLSKHMSSNSSSGRRKGRGIQNPAVKVSRIAAATLTPYWDLIKEGKVRGILAVDVLDTAALRGDLKGTITGAMDKNNRAFKALMQVRPE